MVPFVVLNRYQVASKFFIGTYISQLYKSSDLITERGYFPGPPNFMILGCIFTLFLFLSLSIALSELNE